MIYSIQSKEQNISKDMAFFVCIKIWWKYGKKLIVNGTKKGTDAAKTAFKIVLHKTDETTDDLIGNNIADKITSVNKGKSKDEIHSQKIPIKKHQQIIDDLRLI